MPGALLHVGAQIACPHGSGQVTETPGQQRVLVGGQPVVTLTDTNVIGGCPFTLPNGKPQPCMKVQWTVAATRVTILGQKPLVQSSTGICLSADQIPAGPPSVLSSQTRVTAQ